MFNYTPDERLALGGCRVRTPNSYKLIETGYSECINLFRVQKFFVLEYICYKYQLFLEKVEIEYENSVESDLKAVLPPAEGEDDFEDDKTNDINFTFLELTNTPAAPGLIFSITFERGSAFEHYKYSKFMVHSANSFPYKAVGLSPVIDKSEGSLSERSLTYFRLTKRMLPAPFMTNCFNYRRDILKSKNKSARLTHTQVYQSQTDCNQVCVKKLLMRKIGKIPFSSIETRNRNITPLSYSDVMNETILNELIESYKVCSDECARPDCNEVTTFTRVASSDQDYLEVILNVQNEPSIDVQFQPVLSFPEYFTYFLSCFGTWFGISVIALNPFKRERVEKLKQITAMQLQTLLKKGPLEYNARADQQQINSIECADPGPSSSSAQTQNDVISYNLSPIKNPTRISQTTHAHSRLEVVRQMRVLDVKVKHLENVIKTMQRSRTLTM